MSKMERPGPGAVQVANETVSSTSRVTREGKEIRYALEVIQQPVRARACGAGAKSSADRRPVDPPPIVELKIFERKSNDVEEDITFTMNANYFLFATLEPARNMAQPRGQPDPNRPTVLTGTPVAGMVYLERPSPAGYFIFPDLSVRHEGPFRLSFSLYEELKRAEDDDKSDEPLASTTGDAHVTHRLEVKSQPFIVFSAKKFPGLTESTNLSRVVAEQGCRVRIRRDVRMRKRETKQGKDWDGYEDEVAHARPSMSQEPEVGVYGSLPPPPPHHGSLSSVTRPRSASNASHQSLPLPLSRHPSLEQINQPYSQQSKYGGTGPHTPQSGYAAQTPAYGQSPSEQYAPPSYMQSQPVMQPPQLQYQPQQHYQSAPPMPSHAQHPVHYGYAAAPPAHPQPHGSIEGIYHPQRSSVDYSAHPQPDMRRESIQQQAQPTYGAYQAYPSQPYQHPGYQQAPPQQVYQKQQYGSVDNRAEAIHPSARPSAPILPMPAKTTGKNAMNILPPIATSINHKNLEPSSPTSAVPYGDSYYQTASSLPTPTDSHKRSYSSTFNSTYQNSASKHGARPGEGQPSNALLECDDQPDQTDGLSYVGLSYKRADGSSAGRNNHFIRNPATLQN